jgi:hypothetical protein
MAHSRCNELFNFLFLFEIVRQKHGSSSSLTAEDTDCSFICKTLPETQNQMTSGLMPPDGIWFTETYSALGERGEDTQVSRVPDDWRIWDPFSAGVYTLLFSEAFRPSMSLAQALMQAVPQDLRKVKRQERETKH